MKKNSHKNLNQPGSKRLVVNQFSFEVENGNIVAFFINIKNFILTLCTIRI